MRHWSVPGMFSTELCAGPYICLEGSCIRIVHGSATLMGPVGESEVP